MENDKYLNYIRVLRDREDNKGKKAGITTWSLLVALIYVAWQLIPEFGKIHGKPEQFAYAAGLYSYLQLASIFVFIMLTIPFKTSKRGQFGYRINVFQEGRDTHRWIAYISLTLLLPLACQHYAADFLPPINIKLISIQNQINTYALLFLSVTFAVVEIVVSIFQKSSELPLPFIFVSQGDKVGKVALRIMWVLAMLLGVGNALCAFYFAQLIPLDSFAQILQFSFDFMLAILILAMLLRVTRIDETSVRLEALERDVILYTLDQNIIRERIQEELLGYEAGEWLRKRISNVRFKAAQVCEIARQADELKADVQKINPEYIMEQQGRVMNYSNMLNSLFNEYLAEYNKLDKWLNSVNNLARVYSDQSFSSLLKEVHNQLSEVRNEIGATVPKALSNIKATTSEIEANLEAKIASRKLNPS